MSPSVSPEPPDVALQSLTSEAVFPQKRGVTTAFEKYATYQESSSVSIDSTFDVGCDRSIDDMETPVDIFNTNLEISLTSEAVFPQKCGVTTAFEKYATYQEYQVSSPVSIDSTFDVECDRSIDDMEAYSAYCQTPVDIFKTNLEIDEWEGNVLSM